MDDNFYLNNDMDNYSLRPYTDLTDKPSLTAIDPRLLSSPPQNPPVLLSNERRLSPFDYTIFSPHTPNPTFFEPSDLNIHSYEPMRHQMLGHRRSVSVPPEDLMGESVQPPPAMVFHRGGTPLGDSIGGASKGNSANKKWLKKAAAAQKRQGQRHAPYPMVAGERMQVKRSHTQPAFSRQQQQTPLLGPTSAPQQMVMMAEDQISQHVMQGFDMGVLSSPQFAEFDAERRGVQLPTQLTDVDALAFEARSDVNTAVLGMLGFADRISKDCEAMRGFLRRGFKACEEDEVEWHVIITIDISEKKDVLTFLISIRQEKRTINHKASTLEDGLEMLPLPDTKAEEETTVPITGQEIRDLDGKSTLLLLSTAQY
jgi:hypothetical protein